ncbi:MAG: ThiF family adenylyltransferase, partial [Tannerellaceae bacterium]
AAQAGVMGPVAGLLGTIQATEALKYLTGIGTLLTNRLCVVNALGMNFINLKIARRSDCGTCSAY